MEFTETKLDSETRPRSERSPISPAFDRRKICILTSIDDKARWQMTWREYLDLLLDGEVFSLVKAQ